MKWLIGIVTVAVVAVATGCGSPQKDDMANAATQFVFAKQPVSLETALVGSETITSKAISYVESREILDKKLQIVEQRKKNATKAKSITLGLKKYVGKTWYVFSGASPYGWDCSGMVRWAYEQAGITLEHRASVQKQSGTLFKNPKIGDIVAFTYKGTQSAYHVGIYLGPDKMIHAGNRGGFRTSIVSISKFAGKYSKVTYTRVLEQ